MVVEVHGVSGPGGHAPVVLADRVISVGRGELPDARPANVGDFQRHNLDCQRVSVTGVVQRALWGRIDPNSLEFELADQTGIVTVTMQEAHSIRTLNLVDAELRLTGICSVFFNSRGEWISNRILVSSLEDIEVLAPARDDPFDAPVVTSSGLNPFSPVPPELNRQVVKGTVTLCRPGDVLFVQGPKRGFRVFPFRPVDAKVGDEIEASGFVRMKDGYGVLTEALVRKTGESEVPEPLAITRSEVLAITYLKPWELWNEDYDGTLVSMRGRLLKWEPFTEGIIRLYLDSDDLLLSATVPDSLNPEFHQRLRLGNELELTGICEVELDLNMAPFGVSDLSLLLRDLEDIRVIAAASWWTPERLSRVITIGAITLIVIATWLLALQRRVAAQTRVIRSKVERESILEERQRIARELHDTVQQELTGIGMLLGNASMQVEQTPSMARENLDLAARMVRHCKEESRASIENLHSVALEGMDLPDALEAQLRPLVEVSGAEFTIAVRGETRRLRGRIETALLRIAHEAAANAAKHAGAGTVSVDLNFEVDHVLLKIGDDGCGFDTATQNDTAQRRLGLLSMEQRALKLNAELRIKSTPGSGTLVSVRLPNSLD
ncbi:MAG: histidine kinase [Verrucomicrobiota bacterium]